MMFVCRRIELDRLHQFLSSYFQSVEKGAIDAGEDIEKKSPIENGSMRDKKIGPIIRK
jgi:hypothetical protein